MIHDLTLSFAKGALSILSICRKQLLCLPVVGYTSALRSHQHLISHQEIAQIQSVLGGWIFLDTVDGSIYRWNILCCMLWTIDLKLPRHFKASKRFWSLSNSASWECKAATVSPASSIQCPSCLQHLDQQVAKSVHSLYCDSDTSLSSIIYRSAMICSSLPS